jgi:hypothetical protein
MGLGGVEENVQPASSPARRAAYRMNDDFLMELLLESSLG